MRNPAYAAFSALDPFLDIVREGLAGLVDGDHFSDTTAPDAVFEFRYRFPGWPTKPRPGASPNKRHIAGPRLATGIVDSDRVCTIHLDVDLVYVIKENDVGAWCAASAARD